MVGDAVGFAAVELKPSEPIQLHVVASLELELSVMVAPLHITPALADGSADGTFLTVTLVVYTVAGLHPLPVLLIVNE